MKNLIITIWILINLNIIHSQDTCLPLWPRIEFGEMFQNDQSTQKMVIKFNTKTSCQKSFVTVTDSKGTIRKVYCESSTLKLSQKMNFYQTTIQRCSLSEIQFNEQISYIVYGSNSTSGTAIPYDVNPIKTSIFDPNNVQKQINLLVLADWSQIGDKPYTSLNQSFDKIQTQQKIDGMLISGDIAYDLDSNNGKNYEEFMVVLNRICKYVPFFITTGNHQHNSLDDLTLFYGTFQTFGKDAKLASGLNLGPFYFVGFDPYEILYSQVSSNSLRKNQQLQSLTGLRQMLQKGKSKNKLMITSSHYPLMCSATNKNCEKNTVFLKDYFDLMFEYGVQFYIGAHYHVYERIYPYCQNGTVQKIPSPYDLKQEKCIVSILEGIAGNNDKIVESYDKIQKFTAAVSFGQTGFGLMKVSKNYLSYVHYSTKNLLTVKDSFQMKFTLDSVDKKVNYLLSQE